MGFEVVDELELPVAGSSGDVPGVDAETEDDPIEAGGEGDDVIPIVVGVGSIDDGATEVDGRKVGRDQIEVWGEFLKLQVIVSVVEHGERLEASAVVPLGGTMA